jgi:hypothetical protein
MPLAGSARAEWLEVTAVLATPQSAFSTWAAAVVVHAGPIRCLRAGRVRSRPRTAARNAWAILIKDSAQPGVREIAARFACSRQHPSRDFPYSSNE